MKFSFENIKIIPLTYIAFVLCTTGLPLYLSGYSFFMKLIPLSQNSKTIAGKYFAMVDDNDYFFLMLWRWQVVKSANTFYARRMDVNPITKKNESFLMHRIILGITDSEIWGDHKDHNGLNNQRLNLRPSTISQNSANLSSHVNSTSKYLGVCWLKTRNLWHAAITDKKGKINRLGTFKNEVEAAEAYNKAAIIAHGEFANLNIVGKDFLRLGKRNPPQTSKYKFIYIGGRKKIKYRVVIRHNNTRTHIGYFHTEEEAVIAYNNVAKDFGLEVYKLSQT